MVKSGIVFVVVLSACGFALILWGNLFFRTAGFVFVALALFTAFFFRDPLREIKTDSAALVSPADGRVMDVTLEDVEGFGRGRVVKIFLSIFDVHLQRSPLSGVVQKTFKTPGLFKPAYAPDAADLNARNTIEIQSGSVKLQVIQITGLIARRIECWVNEGQSVGQGEKIGFIRFGSQVDLVVPESVNITVRKGDKVAAGLTVIGRIE